MVQKCPYGLVCMQGVGPVVALVSRCLSRPHCLGGTQCSGESALSEQRSRVLAQPVRCSMLVYGLWGAATLNRCCLDIAQDICRSLES